MRNLPSTSSPTSWEVGPVNSSTGFRGGSVEFMLPGGGSTGPLLSSANCTCAPAVCHLTSQHTRRGRRALLSSAW